MIVKAHLAKRRSLLWWVVIILTLGILCLGWWLYSWLRVPRLTPVAIIHGEFIGDLSSVGILTLKDQLLYHYDWAGNKKAEYPLPAYDLNQLPAQLGWDFDQGGWILFDWASSDFLHLRAGDEAWPINRNRTLPHTGQLARFSPSGECIGALVYQQKTLLIKVWRQGKLYTEAKLPLDPHGLLNGRQVVDLLVAD